MFNPVGDVREAEIDCCVKTEILVCAVCGGKVSCLRSGKWQGVGATSTQALSITLGRHASSFDVLRAASTVCEALIENFKCCSSLSGPFFPLAVICLTLVGASPFGCRTSRQFQHRIHWWSTCHPARHHRSVIFWFFSEVEYPNQSRRLLLSCTRCPLFVISLSWPQCDTPLLCITKRTESDVLRF